MKTVNVAAITLLLILALLIITCEFSTGGSNTFNSTEPELSKASLYEEFATFMDIRNSITQHVIASGANPDELMHALQASDMQRFGELINMSQEKVTQLQASMDATVASIRTKRPDASIDRASTEDCCDIQVFFAEFYPELLDTTRPVAGLGKRSDDACDGGVSCEYNDYVMSLAGCTVLGPYLYWVCSYFAMCEFCHGGWIDNVC